MTVDDIQTKLVDAVERGYIDSDVLDSVNDRCVASRSAVADTRDALSSLVGDSSSLTRSECLGRFTRLLAGSLSRVSCQEPNGVLRAVFSYDGGMEISFFGKWGLMDSGATTPDRLKPLREKCVAMNNSSPVVLGGYPFWLLPRGAKSGFGCFSFQLLVEEEGREKFRFLLHTTPSDKIPGLRVKVSYQAFRYGRSLRSVYNEILQLVAAMGFTVDRECLSRIDFNLTINQSIACINRAFREDRICNRSREVMLHGKSQFNSYRVGNINTIEFAVYDKVKELQDRYDADKINDLEKYMGDCANSSWTRYEFRLGRKWLNKIEVDTVEQFLENELSIMNFLTFDWYFVKKSSWRSGKKVNYTVDDFWLIVRLCFLIAALSDNHYLSMDRDSCKRKSSQALSLNIIGRCVEDIASNLPRVKPLPRRRFRKNIKNVLKVSIGCMVSAILTSCPANYMMSKPDFQKTLVRSCSYLADEAYEKYQKNLMLIDGLERDTSQYVVDQPNLTTES